MASLPAAPIFWTSETAISCMPICPALKRRKIHIDLDGDCLTISAEHNEEVTQQEGSNYVRRERRCGSLSRSFDVSGVDVQNISASYENGVLQLDLPKKSAQQPTTQRIEIK